MTGKVAEMRQKHVLEAKRDMGSSDGNQMVCRQCGKEIAAGRRKTYCSQECGVAGKKNVIRQWQKRHPENLRANVKKWARKNPEKIKEASRRRYKANPEKIKKQGQMWRKNNPEKAREHDRRWRKNNPEKARENSRQWHRNNPEKSKEGERRWRKNNPEKVRGYWRSGNERRRKKAMEAAGK